LLVGGLLIGGVLAQFANWRWVFFLVAIPIAGICILFIPPQPSIAAKDRPGLDPIDISILTRSLLYLDLTEGLHH
jgi:MFS family permease